jgi:2-phosphoglycerate kinase
VVDRESEDPLIILIGGTAGCGKTTLANRLLGRFDLDHRLGTGFIRAVVQSQTDPDIEPWLFVPSYQSEDPIGHLSDQSRRLFTAVSSCIDRARTDGTSLVIEGTHLIPELYKDCGTRFIVLTAPDIDVHRLRLVGQRHTRRSVSTEDLAHIREIGGFYEREALRLDIPTLRFEDNFDEAARALGLAIPTHRAE